MLLVVKVSSEAILFTPLQYLLLFATVIKGIAPLHLTIKCVTFLTFYWFQRAIKGTLEPVKSQKFYTLYKVYSHPWFE